MNLLGQMRNNLLSGLHFARRAPAVTATTVLVLALGIGASTAIFSILYAVSLRPLPYKDPGQLVVLFRTQVTTSAFRGGTVTMPVPLPFASGQDFLHWRDRSNVFSALAAAQLYRASAVSGGRTEQLRGYEVTPDFFRIFDVRAKSGRLFAARNEQRGRDHVLILGPGIERHGSWESGIKVGGTLVLNKQEYAVVGSVPSTFRVADVPMLAIPEPDFFIPVPFAQLTKVPDPNALFPGILTVIGRLKPGTTIGRAQAEMTTISAGLAKQYAGLYAGVGVVIKSMQSEVGLVPKVFLTLLILGIGFLLLIACVNISVMLLAQGTRRRREIAIRQALGASRASIVGQLFSECLFLALSGAVGGILIAFWLKDALVSRIPSIMLPIIAPAELNWQVLGFALGISVTAAIVFGLIPALQLSLQSSSELLREAAFAASESVRSVWLRDTFVVCEVTLAFALLIACGLMVQGIRREVLGNPGYDAKRMVAMNVNLVSTTYRSFALRENVYRSMLLRVQASSLVRSAALDSEDITGSVTSADRLVTPIAFKTGLRAQVHSVTPGYFRTMQIPLVQGRLFTWADYAGKPAVAIVNQTLACALWPTQSPISRYITTTFPAEPREVVGVVSNPRTTESAMGSYPQVYLPELAPESTLMVRTTNDAKGAMAAIHDMVAGIGPAVQVSAPRTMQEIIAERAKPIGYIVLILGFFGLMALLLATVGVFAVTAYSVSQRTHEIGVRMALGAQRWQVLLVVTWAGTRLSLYGVGIGLLGALGLGKVLSHFLNGVGIGALSTYFGVALLLSTVAIAASYIAARRAARIDPMNALRCQ